MMRSVRRRTSLCCHLAGGGWRMTFAQLRNWHPWATMSGGGAGAVFVDYGIGQLADSGRGTIAIGLR